MTTATAKTGRVSNIKDVRGVIEYRFVPVDWVAPLPYLTWYVFNPVTHTTEYEKWRNDIEQRQRNLGGNWDYKVTWLTTKPEPYTMRVDFDPIDRPILVAIGNI